MPKIKLTRGERFKDARARLPADKRSTHAVYKATGVSVSIINALENDDVERDVGYKSVETLAKYYGVSIDYLLGRSEIRNDEINGVRAVDIGLSEEIIQYLLWWKEFSAKKGTCDFEKITAELNSFLSYDKQWDLHEFFWEVSLLRGLGETVYEDNDPFNPTKQMFDNMDRRHEIANELPRISGNMWMAIPTEDYKYAKMYHIQNMLGEYLRSIANLEKYDEE